LVALGSQCRRQVHELSRKILVDKEKFHRGMVHWAEVLGYLIKAPAAARPTGPGWARR
jgi:hypothetical protein